MGQRWGPNRGCPRHHGLGARVVRWPHRQGTWLARHQGAHPCRSPRASPGGGGDQLLGLQPREPTSSAAGPVVTQARGGSAPGLALSQRPRREDRANKAPGRLRPFPISFPLSGQRVSTKTASSLHPRREPLRHQCRTPPTGGLIRLRENRCREGACLFPVQGTWNVQAQRRQGLVPEQWKVVLVLRLSPRLRSLPRSRGTVCGWC